MGEIICKKCGWMNSHLRYHRGEGCEICGNKPINDFCPSCDQYCMGEE